MKIEFDLDKEEWLTLKHIKCLIDNKLMKMGFEDVSTEYVRPLEIMDDMESKMGRTIPVADLQSALEKEGFSKKESASLIDSLKKEGLIFELRRGFIQKI
jgi:hypothetical protein